MNPGSFDVLHFDCLFKSYNRYEIPELQTGHFVDADFIPFNVVTRTDNVGVHCFVYDYYLERIWKRPNVYVKYLQKSKVFFTPDFSIYTDIPESLQIFNTYRNRWVGAYMQNEDINVIPTVSWGLKNTFRFCFLGIPKNSTVAISSVGVLVKNEHLFKAGCEKMKEVINPVKVYVYGDKHDDYLSSLFDIHIIETFSKSMRNRIKMTGI
jgi:hypothetical protein